MVFSRLPLDKGNQCSMRHMKAVLHDYINELNALQDKTNDDLIPTPEEVAEWALLSFCGIVAANGLDERQTRKRTNRENVSKWKMKCA